MLTGRIALEGDDIVQLGFTSGNPERRPTPRALGAAVPDAVEAVFQKALAVKPQERYPRAGDFWGALGEALGGSPLSIGAALSMASGAVSRHALTAPTELAPASLGVPTPPSTTGGSTAATGDGPKSGSGKAAGLVIAAAVAVGALGVGGILLSRSGAPEPGVQPTQPVPGAALTGTLPAAAPAPSAAPP
jgi:hypothetical protein